MGFFHAFSSTGLAKVTASSSSIRIIPCQSLGEKWGARQCFCCATGIRLYQYSIRARIFGKYGGGYMKYKHTYFHHSSNKRNGAGDPVRPWNNRNLTDFRRHAQYRLKRLLLVKTRFKRCTFMPSGAGHRGVTICGCAVICLTVFLALVARAASCRCYQYPQGIKARCLLFG